MNLTADDWMFFGAEAGQPEAPAEFKAFEAAVVKSWERSWQLSGEREGEATYRPSAFSKSSSL